MDSCIQENYQHIRQQITKVCTSIGRDPEEIQLITVTKTKPLSVVQSVLNLGYIHIGENRVQEIVQKVPKLLGKKIVHMIGHLQTNKVSKIVPLVDWVHSVDSEKLLLKIDDYCAVYNKKMNILIQVNTSGETSKFGCQSNQAQTLANIAIQCTNLTFRGFMTIGPLGRNEEDIHESFRILRKLKEKCDSLTNNPLELSMGMSDDYPIAIQEGSTMIRLGTLILGKRDKPHDTATI